MWFSVEADRKAAETVGRDSRGYDAGKKINGRKRHMVVDTRGLPLLVMVTPADLHDSAAAREVLFRLCLMHPKITIVWADSAYVGKLVTWAKRHLNLTNKPVSRPMDASGFVVLPRRWVVEQSLCLDDARPPACAGLRTTRPAFRNADHLGGYHSHDQASCAEGSHPKLAEETDARRRLTEPGMQGQPPRWSRPCSDRRGDGEVPGEVALALVLPDRNVVAGVPVGDRHARAVFSQPRGADRPVEAPNVDMRGFP
ncbi:hypothetical protein GCM10009574_099630 [Streptomyces asiaticus]|uniref:Transposase IS4-like domain-containing protein n=2 Tax=Streptomyces rhizosphaericus TaxID=114699 RepID=A0ABP4CA13_9ACTN